MNHLKKLINDVDKLNYYAMSFNGANQLNKRLDGSINMRYHRISTGNHFSIGDRMIVKSNTFSSIINNIFRQHKNALESLND